MQEHAHTTRKLQVEKSITGMKTMPRINDVYGRLTVTKANITLNGKQGKYCECLCECGNTTVVRTSLLTASPHQNNTKSCGCLRGESHRLSYELTYRSWSCMKYRCNNPTNTAYKQYGGRGIQVCERWNNSFIAFLEDMGIRPDKTYSIDRIDNNGHYEPGNCRWATLSEQANNTRRNHVITFNGKTQTVKQWSTSLNIPYGTLETRIRRGWTVEKAFTTSVN